MLLLYDVMYVILCLCYMGILIRTNVNRHCILHSGSGCTVHVNKGGRSHPLLKETNPGILTRMRRENLMNLLMKLMNTMEIHLQCHHIKMKDFSINSLFFFLNGQLTQL